MTRFIIVDAVKGGCGKTTEALAAAINCYSELKDAGVKEPKICIIDMDLLGTSMEKMIYNKLFIKADKAGSLIKDSADQYLNDLVLNNDAFSKKYKTQIDIKLDSGKKCPVDFVISSPREQDRRKFKVSSNSNYTMQVTPTHFRGTVKKLIEQLMFEEYHTVIFDMPPNSDAYTDCVFDLLLDSEYRDKNKEDIESVELRIVSTYDKSHIFANKNWLVDLYQGRDHHWEFFNDVIFILNNSYLPETEIDKALKGDSSESFEKLNKAIRKDILDSLPNSKYKAKIKFKYREYSTKLLKYFLFNNNEKILDFSDVGSWYLLIDII